MQTRNKKRAALLSVILVFSLALGVVLALLMPQKEDDAQPLDRAKIEEMTEQGAQSAFSQLEIGGALPFDVRGYYIAPDESESTDSVFEKIDAISPNTVIIEYDGDKADYIASLASCARELELCVVLYTQSLGEDSLSVCQSVGAELLLVPFSQASEDFGDIRARLKEGGVSLGLLADSGDTDAFSLAPDFIFLSVTGTDAAAAEPVISSWAALSVQSETRLFALIDNSGVNNSNSSSLNDTLRLAYYGGGFEGCVMSDRYSLYEDRGMSATNLYSFYEYFSAVDMAALTVTDAYFDEVSCSLVIKGTSDNGYPVFVGSGSDIWNRADNSGEDGSFTASVSISDGVNTVSVRHKNAAYTYSVRKNIRLLSSCSAQLSEDGGRLDITATSVEGASVYASVANTRLVALEHVGGGEYSASFEIPVELSAVNGGDVSFAASYNGIIEKKMCSEQVQPSVYADNGCGQALMCVVKRDYSEVTSAESDSDSSDPTYTPQLAGSCDKVDKIGAVSGHIVYSLSSGMKIYAEDCELVVGGYLLPERTVSLSSVTSDAKGDTLVFTGCSGSFLRMTAGPQEYSVGFLEREFNVESLTAEYIELSFYGAVTGATASDLTFGGCTAVGSASWLDSDGCAAVRVSLKEKGGVSGVIIEKTESGVSVTVKKRPASLEGLVVMLDPGHGGYGAPGTSYRLSVYEKDITLKVALKTADILREYGAQVYLTRETDESVSLSERVAMLRSIKPDIFISVHCDGYDNENQYGTHTYYYTSLSQPLARCVHSELVGAYRSYYYTDPDSSQYENVDMNYKFYPYMVTRVFECPSVLAELGCLTNENDSAFLSSENGMQILATALAQGIVNYMAGL